VTDPESGCVLVPIFHAKRDCVKGTVHCTRTQFPLTIVYAITIHKSQGLSVDRAVLNPGKHSRQQSIKQAKSSILALIADFMVLYLSRLLDDVVRVYLIGD
jgi:hypothetical protein